MRKIVALCVSLPLLAALPSQADQQQVFRGMEKGKAAFVGGCTTCHDAKSASAGARDREGWGKIIEKMVAKGAKIKEEDRVPLLDYLATGSLLWRKCSVCHSVQVPLSKNKDLPGWQKTVTRMSGKRPGHMSQEEVEQITGYLAVERPSP